MSKYLQYKNYFGSAEFSEEDEVFHGKVIGIRSLISYEGDSVNTLTEDFRGSIDQYLAFCKERGIEPEKPFRGSFNVRIDTELHRKAALTASARGISLNALIEDALRQAVS